MTEHDNTSGCPCVYLKCQVGRRGDWSGEYFFWQAYVLGQAQSPSTLIRANGRFSNIPQTGACNDIYRKLRKGRLVQVALDATDLSYCSPVATDSR